MKTKPLITLGLFATLGLSPAAAHAATSTPWDAGSGGGTSQMAATSLASSSAPAASRWRLVDISSDIDGDRSTDRVAMRRLSPRACQVRVTVGKDRASVRTLRHDPGRPCEYHGSGQLDPVKGAEISLVTGRGAHTPWHTVLTWRQGGLAVERAPHRLRWTIDGAAMVSEGYTRVRTPRGKVRLIHHSFLNNGKRWSGPREVLAYRDGRWVTLKRARVTVRPKVATQRGGWHVPGFPRWA